MKKTTSTLFLRISLLLLIVSACQPDSEGESRDITVTVDGESIAIDPHDFEVLFFNTTVENHDMEIAGMIPGYDENRFFSLQFETLEFSELTEGTIDNTTLRSVDYTIEIGDTYEDFIDYDQYFIDPDPYFTFDSIEIYFDHLSDSRIAGEVTLTFQHEGESATHIVNFDYSKPGGGLIGNSYYTDGGGDGDGDGDGNGDGDGSSGDCSIEDYNGPEFDIQVDAQCKAAYIYDCVGDEDARDAACALYYQYGEEVWTGTGPLPECPYCP